MADLRFAVLGCGFWAQFQIAAWRELGGVRPVALYNRTRARAEALGKRFGVKRIYSDVEELLSREAESLDFVDIITAVEAHADLVELVARYALPVICQKPMSTDLPAAERMVATCRHAGVPFMVHENWRWQYPIRQLRRTLTEEDLGRCFRARITFSNSFPVFDNQPFLRDLEQFILTDIGSYILDTARFLFGDARTLYCRTHRVNPGIRGEDVATVVMDMGEGTTVTCEMSYATAWERERFPQTYVFAECENGSAELGPDYWVRVTREGTTAARQCPPPTHEWADPAYALVHDSIVPCNADLLRALRGEGLAETDAADNIKTVRLVFAAYDSAATNSVVRFDS